MVLRTMVFAAFSINDCGETLGTFEVTVKGIFLYPSEGTTRWMSWDESTLPLIMADQRDAVMVNKSLLPWVGIFASVICGIGVLDIMEYTLGSRPLCATMSVLTMFNVFLLFACGSLPIDTALVGDVGFTQAMCAKLITATAGVELAPAKLANAQGGLAGSAAVTCLVAGILSTIQFFITVRSFIRAKGDAYQIYYSPKVAEGFNNQSIL